MATYAFSKLSRSEVFEVPRQLLKHRWHAESGAGSTDDTVLAIPVAPALGPRESGTEPAARNAQVVGEASTGVGAWLPVLGSVRKGCKRVTGDAARIAS
jgi:hypothetical protein